MPTSTVPGAAPSPDAPASPLPPRYAAVAVEAPLAPVYHYRIPDHLLGRVQPGDRVAAPFGHRQTIRGVCVGVFDTPGTDRPLKDLRSVSPPEERIPEDLVRLARWTADYYHSGWGTVLAAAVPGGVRRDSGSAERLHVALAVSPDDARREAEKRRPRAPRQAELLERLASRAATEEDVPLAELFDPAPPAAAAGERPEAEASGTPAGKKDKDPSPGYAAAAKALAKAGLATVANRPRKRKGTAWSEARRAVQPTPAQEQALSALRASLSAGTFKPFLLHGVTGSGKTEVYLGAMETALSLGKSTLVLVPEISLTPQTVGRFVARAGDTVAVLHSHLSDGERAREWRRLRSGEARVAVGARSAVFAPVRDLGLVIVDEEHERTFKQENDPRYHARDLAVVRARDAGATAVLGSATPSLESWANVLSRKYALLTLRDRPGGAKPPQSAVVDLVREWDEMKSATVLSRRLEEAMDAALARNEQIILFLNRRGFHTTVMCHHCGETLQCDHCAVPLAFHRRRQQLRCHFCGHEREIPKACPYCGMDALKYSGTGTERVEAVLAKRFPKARVLRMDSDTMGGVGAHAEALARFGRGEADILLGTQMIAKGLDFPNVTLVGVLVADGALSLPEFRAAERIFQLVAQVAGRAGRGAKPGRAVVQAFRPQHHAIEKALAEDYVGFARLELADREALHYPPYTRLARILAVGPDEGKTAALLAETAAALSRCAPPGGEVLGPAPCSLSRAEGQFRHHVLLKCPTSGLLRTWLAEAGWPWKDAGGAHIIVDIDPQSLL